MFNGSTVQSNYVRLCNKDLLKSPKYTYCLNYTSIRNNYIFLWNIYRYRKSENHKPGFIYGWSGFYSSRLYRELLEQSIRWERLSPEGTVAKSWTEVSEFCKSIGGSLPSIRNRGELDKIINFLKLSKDMPPVEALYIGLRRGFKIQVTLTALICLHQCNI